MYKPYWFAWVVIFECHDILMLGKSSIKWKQRPDMTIAECLIWLISPKIFCPNGAQISLIYIFRYHNIGQVNDHQVQIIDGKLLIVYGNGEVCAKNKSDVYTTHVHLKCDKNAQVIFKIFGPNVIT